MSIAARFFLVSLLVVALALYQLIDVVTGELKPRSREAIEETLVDTAYLTASLLAETSFPTDAASLGRSLGPLREVPLTAQIYDLKKDNVDLRISVTDGKGTVLFDSFESANVGKDFSSWRNIKLTLDGSYGARTTRDNPDDPTSTVLYVTAPIRRAGAIVGTVTLAKPTKSSNYFVDIAKKRLFRQSAVTLLAMLALSAALSVLVSRPIRRLTEYARKVRDGGSPKLPKLGGGETAELGQAFEEMREALEGKKSIERYVQTLTHELKSPLTAIQGAAELLEEGEMPAEKRALFLSNIRTETARIKQLIERLLELASLEAKRSLEQLEGCVLDELADDALRSFGPRVQQKGLTVRWENRETVEIRGDRFLLRQAMANIIDNAVEHSPTGGELILGVSAERGGTFSVSDCGPGIPEFALNRVTERFFSLPRKDTGKKSSGLGLAFVSEVAKLHGGRVEVSNRSQASISGRGDVNDSATDAAGAATSRAAERTGATVSLVLTGVG